MKNKTKVLITYFRYAFSDRFKHLLKFAGTDSLDIYNVIVNCDICENAESCYDEYIRATQIYCLMSVVWKVILCNVL